MCYHLPITPLINDLTPIHDTRTTKMELYLLTINDCHTFIWKLEKDWESRGVNLNHKISRPTKQCHKSLKRSFPMIMDYSLYWGPNLVLNPHLQQLPFSVTFSRQEQSANKKTKNFLSQKFLVSHTKVLETRFRGKNTTWKNIYSLI